MPCSGAPSDMEDAERVRIWGRAAIASRRRGPCRPPQPRASASIRASWFARGFVGQLSTVLLALMHVALVFVAFVPCTRGGPSSRRPVISFACGRSRRATTATSRIDRSRRAARSSSSSGSSAPRRCRTDLLWWASWHRRHHRFSDTPPTRTRRCSAASGTRTSGGSWRRPRRARSSNVRDLARYPELVFLESTSGCPIVAYALGCFAIGGCQRRGVGLRVSTIAVLHATTLINSLAHGLGHAPLRHGRRLAEQRVLAHRDVGRGWHNNHHHVMTSAREGFRWWEIDGTHLGFVLRARSRGGVVWDVREPSAAKLAAPRPRARSRATPDQAPARRRAAGAALARQSTRVRRAPWTLLLLPRGLRSHPSDRPLGGRR